jgi:hypothetical protein
MMISTRIKGGLVCALVALALVAGSAAPTMAHDPYRDSDSNYLKIIDYFTFPVGIALEWLVARPLHMLDTRGIQGLRAGRVSQVGTQKIKRGCRGPRPPRYCTDTKFEW